MEGQQIVGSMPVPVETAIEAAADLGLPFGVVLLGELAEISYEFESLVGTQDLRGPFHLGNAH